MLADVDTVERYIVNAKSVGDYWKLKEKAN